ncbi:MAG: Tat pathway signal protein [Chloroflexi bacterium HGW-Chloroflexi-5]|nr:MAG: Tat pathway signal protein [Chloroflexi bacterium HGW-Chloroflexi-5]
MKKKWFLVLAILLLGIPAFLPAAALGDTYPSRPITMIVPFPPGGATDLTARPIAAALEPILKQPVAVVNKPGAGGVVGMQFAAVSKPDGYTLLAALATISVMPEVDAIFGRPRTYERSDFAPIALLNADTTVLVTLKDAPWNSVADLVADAKKRPKEIKFSTAGMYSGLHLPMAMFTQAAGIEMRHIPFQGGGPALTALLGGHADVMAASPSMIAGHMKAGTLKVLGCWGGKRLEAFPDTKTFIELGYPDVEFYIWSGLFVPRATPPEIVNTLREAVKKAVQSPEFKTAMGKLQTPVYYLDAPEFQKFWDKDAARLVKAVRAIGKEQ